MKGKLSRIQVLEIYKRLNAGEIAEAIAEDFPVCGASVRAIGSGKCWGDITGIAKQIPGKPIRRGSKSHLTTITEEQALAIDGMFGPGVSIPAIARAMGVPITIVRAIHDGMSWAWLTGREKR